MNFEMLTNNVLVTEDHSTCSHLKVGDIAASVTSYYDVCGTVDAHAMCNACTMEALDEASPVTVYGNYCLEVIRVTLRSLLRTLDIPVRPELLAALEAATQLRFETSDVVDGSVSYYINIDNLPQVIIDDVNMPELLIRHNDVMCQLRGKAWGDRTHDSTTHPTPYAPAPDAGLTIRPLTDYEMVECHDCDEPVYLYEARTWKNWDFSPAEGDEELVLCKCCYLAPRHQERISKDAVYRQRDEDDNSDM